MNSDRKPDFPASSVPETATNRPGEKAPRQSAASLVFDYVEMFVWAIAAVMILFTFFFRISTVEGRSMETTFFEGQTLILRSVFYEPEQDDVVVFHQNDSGKKLIKRVIATGGQTLVIDTSAKTITVDGAPYADEHATFQYDDGYRLGSFNESMGYDPATGVLTLEVPEGYLFVMGDNRNNSMDSRYPSVGFVDERAVLGKVVLRLKPFTLF